MAIKQNSVDDKREKQRQENTGMSRRSTGWPFSSEPGMLSSREAFYNPFQMMRRMSEEMDRIFGGYARGQGGEGSAWSPALEVTEREGKYIVRAELAGLKPEEVKIEVADANLIIEGERKSDYDDTQGGYRRTEHRYGRFYRSLALPEGVNPDQVKARFENGMLEITIPAPAQRQSDRRQIPIEGAPGTGNTGTNTGTNATANQTPPKSEPHG